MDLKRHSIAKAIVISLLLSLFFQMKVSGQELDDNLALKLAAASAKAGAELSEKQRSFIDSHIEWAIELGDKVEADKGSQPPIVGVVSESAYETGWGTSNFCSYYNNDFGLGGIDNPKGFVSHKASWEYYYDLVSTRTRYVEKGSLSATNTYEYISALVAGGYCPDDGYLRDVLDIAIKIKPYVDARVNEIRAEQEAVARAEEARERRMAYRELLGDRNRVPK